MKRFTVGHVSGGAPINKLLSPVVISSPGHLSQSHELVESKRSGASAMSMDKRSSGLRFVGWISVLSFVFCLVAIHAIIAAVDYQVHY